VYLRTSETHDENVLACEISIAGLVALNGCLASVMKLITITLDCNYPFKLGFTANVATNQEKISPIISDFRLRAYKYAWVPNIYRYIAERQFFPFIDEFQNIRRGKVVERVVCNPQCLFDGAAISRAWLVSY